MGLGDLMDAERQLGIDPPKRKQPTTPSTPAPQGEKCAHAPEIPEREQVFMRTGLIRVMYDAGKMDDYLVRERESRQQAEAALAFFLDDPRVDVAVGGNPHYIDRRYAEIRAAYPERPIPQEPAERERGK